MSKKYIEKLAIRKTYCYYTKQRQDDTSRPSAALCAAGAC